MKKRLIMKLAVLLAIVLFGWIGPVFSQRVINVDANKIKGHRNEMFNECIGAGRAEEGLRADRQQQLRQIQREMPPATAMAFKAGFRKALALWETTR
jgi:hypothetical protein